MTMYPDEQPTESLRAPPHNINAEQSVLGGLMLDNAKWDLICDVVNADDFYRREHRELFRAIAKLADNNDPFDVVTVAERMEIAGELEAAGGLSYLGIVVNDTPSAANILAYAKIVREKAIGRRAIASCLDAVDRLYSAAEKPADVMARHMETCEAMTANRASGPVHVRVVMAEVREYLDTVSQPGGSIGVRTGFSDLDAQLGGLAPGDMIVIAARPSVGKTTLAQNIAECVARTAPRPVLMFSLEMARRSLGLRTVASSAPVSHERARSGRMDADEWRRATAVTFASEGLNLLIDDSGGLTLDDVRARARRLHREHRGLSLIVVDYLQLLSMGGRQENRNIEIMKISQGMKALAKALDAPVIAVSQLSRAVDGRAEKRPVLSDLRDSGSIEQDADIVILGWREKDDGIVAWDVAKHRNGPIGVIHLLFQGDYVRFVNMARPYQPAPSNPTFEYRT
jgi:replicative DNA helicase